ncbi:MAG TPA: hypothetical protein VFN35_21760, partial [Ktedonobacteraceae bacterium]|nr:hypothetical protein [Ktedonobacteraceae bacterium]
VVSFTLPTAENTSAFHVRLSISGFAFTQQGTRAACVAHLGDQTVVVSLPQPPKSEGEFLQVVETTFPAGAEVQTTLFLLAERDSSNTNLVAKLNILSLDFSLEK